MLSDNGVIAIAIPQSKIKSPLVEQASWVIDHGLDWNSPVHGAGVNKGAFNFRLLPKEGPYTAVAVGPGMIRWAALFHLIENSAYLFSGPEHRPWKEPNYFDVGGLPYVEPVVFIPLGAVEAGKDYELPAVDYPSSTDSSTQLEGRCLDSDGQPVQTVMLLAPARGNVGAFVISDSSGKYSVAGLVPGAYACFASARRNGGWIHALFDVEITSSAQQKSLRFDP
jgi:hypothetical protein